MCFTSLFIMTKPTYLLSHDLGTTGDKATLFTAEGVIIASAFAPYSTHYPRPGWAEQNPQDWWSAVCASTRKLLLKAPEATSRLAGVGFSAMMNGCLLIDGVGNPLHSGLIHADLRSQKQAERIAQEFGEAEGYRITGNRIAPYFTLSKLAWFAENSPLLLEKAAFCVQTKDYISGKLTGNWGFTDYSDASLTGCFDLENKTWAQPLIEAGNFPARLLPQAFPSTHTVGKVTRQAALETGLPEGLPVVIGAGDGACATAGAGAVHENDSYHYLGGTSWVASLTDSYRPDPLRRVSVFCAASPNQYVVYGTVQSAGSSVDWFRNAIGVGRADNEEEEFAALELLASSVPPGSKGLFFLPYLAGERSPIWDSNTRGVYFGLTSAHGRGELARSVFEGVAYALSSNLAVLEELGLAPECVRVLGGGMRSPLWRSILSAVYQRPLLLLERLSEATSCGAAMATAVGVGLYPDFASAAPAFAPTGEREEPDAQAMATYRQSSAFFQSLYPVFAERFSALNDYLQTVERD